MLSAFNLKATSLMVWWCISAYGMGSLHVLESTTFTLTFMHLADVFIQRDLQRIQAIHFCQYVCSLGIEPTTFCTANAMLYHGATGKL